MFQNVKLLGLNIKSTHTHVRILLTVCRLRRCLSNKGLSATIAQSKTKPIFISELKKQKVHDMLNSLVNLFLMSSVLSLRETKIKSN